MNKYLNGRETGYQMNQYHDTMDEKVFHNNYGIIIFI